MKTFSILTPSLNQAAYLERAILSVHGQDESVEHIVVDGGSSDKTLDVLRKHAERFAWWTSEPDRGQSHALNKALAHAHGEIVGWLNADDFYLPGAFEAAAQVFRKTPDAVIVYGDYIRVDENGKPYAWRRQPSFNYWDCLFAYPTVQNAAAFFKRSAIVDAGGWDEGLHFAMDYDMVLKLASLGPVIHVRRYLGAFRLHKRSKTATIADLGLRECMLIRKRHLGRDLGRWGWWWRHKYHKGRVFLRMLREGCLGSRLGWDRRDSS